MTQFAKVVLALLVILTIFFLWSRILTGGKNTRSYTNPKLVGSAVLSSLDDSSPSNKSDSSDLALINAVRAGNTRLVKSLIDHGTEVNAADQMGGTPLLDSILFNHPEIMRILVAHGTNVNAQDDSGATPLFFTAGSVQEVTILLANGADVNHRDKDGVTPLLMGAGCPAVVKLLLAHGAKVNATTQNGETALMAAAHCGSAKAVNILLAYGADVNATDTEVGRTALMCAAQSGRGDSLAAIKALVNHGTNVDLKDNKGNTALTLAERSNKPNVVHYLKSIGAK